MPGTSLEDVATWRRLYLAAKPFHVGVNVDGLACPLHNPMTYSRQTGRHDFLSDTVLSCCYSGRWRLSGGCEAPGLDIRWSIDRMGNCAIETYME
jgi:hypothetical protein